MLNQELKHSKNICDVANIVYDRIISLHGKLIRSDVRTLMYCHIQINIFVLRLSNYSEIFKKFWQATKSASVTFMMMTRIIHPYCNISHVNA